MLISLIRPKVLYQARTPGLGFKKPRAGSTSLQSKSGEAFDPVCGMTVEIASAHFMSEHERELYYFCAAGCKAAFDENPLAYLKPSGVAHDSWLVSMWMQIVNLIGFM